MTIQAVLLPVFVQIFLTFALAIWMGVERVGALQRRELTHADIALGERNWPPRAQQIANAFHNQLEFPILFYILVILAWMTKDADLLFVIMSWIFVAFRLWHAYVHVTSNSVQQRARIFGGAVLTLIVMWAIFAVRVLLGT